MDCQNELLMNGLELPKDRGDHFDGRCQQPTRNLYEDLCTKFGNLYEKWKCNQPRRRIQELAIPKHWRSKYRPPVLHRFGRATQIIKDEPLSTRSEQLAYSPVRRLIATRDAVRDYASPVIYERFNKYIHRGMYSMYTRLGNSMPPLIINPIEPWTKDDWKMHTEKLKKLAHPKRTFYPPSIVRISKPLNKLEDRIESLATPKIRPTKYRPRPLVSPAAMKYEATERTLELSKPKPGRELPPKKQRTFRGKKYDASPRTKELAQHREKKTAESDTRENPFQVSPTALKARATERVRTLAKHREFAMAEAKDLTKISPAALKAIASKRIVELAQPKNPRTKVGG